MTGANSTFEHNFIGPICSNPGDHADGIQAVGAGQNNIVHHNTIDLRTAVDFNAPIFFADNSESATVTDNLVMGGNFSIRIHDDATPDIGPWIITGNRIVTGSYSNSPASTVNTTCATTTWTNNRLVTINASYVILTTGAVVDC